MQDLEFEALIKEHLENLEDRELIFLKGHLVIEQLITELLQLSLTQPERLSSMRLMFHNKLECYLSIDGNSIISEGLESVLKSMNSLRNKLAHSLDHPNFDQLLIEWIERASKSRVENHNDDIAVRAQLISGISYIAAFLSGAIHAKKCT